MYSNDLRFIRRKRNVNFCSRVYLGTKTTLYLIRMTRPTIVVTVLNLSYF